jgi:hypothetical protein
VWCTVLPCLPSARYSPVPNGADRGSSPTARWPRPLSLPRRDAPTPPPPPPPCHGALASAPVNHGRQCRRRPQPRPHLSPPTLSHDLCRHVSAFGGPSSSSSALGGPSSSSSARPALDLRRRVFTTLARDLRRRPHLGQVRSAFGGHPRPHPLPRAHAHSSSYFRHGGGRQGHRRALCQGTESPTGSSSPPTGSSSWRCSSGHPISSPPASTSRSARASNPTRHRSPHQGNLDFLLFPQKIASVTYIAHGNRSNFFGFGRLRATGVLTLCMSKCSFSENIAW